MAKLIIEYYLDKKDLELHQRLSSSRQFSFDDDYQQTRVKNYNRYRMFTGMFIVILSGWIISSPVIWPFPAAMILLLLISVYRGKVRRNAFDERMRLLEERGLPKTGEIKLGITSNYLYDYDDAETFFKISTSEVKGVEEDEHFFTITLTDKFSFIIPRYKLSFTDVINVRLRLRQLTNFIEIEYYTNKEE